MTPGRPGPEQTARRLIDDRLTEAGWLVQDRDQMNLHAGRGVAVREFKLTEGHGYADYLLFVDQRAVGVLEAKSEGFTLTGVEVQAQKYSTGLPSVPRIRALLSACRCWGRPAVAAGQRPGWCFP